eukprot:superscaffoldBa00002685_g14990
MHYHMFKLWFQSDPLQFAYRANRSVDDAVNKALHFMLQHLDSAGTHTRILFVDFSSAFNTIILALLQDKLSQLHVSDSTCRWITNFLSDRKQHMRLGKHDSDSWTIGTGSLQGCFFSPFFFSLHTVKLLKFVDDTTLIELISAINIQPTVVYLLQPPPVCPLLPTPFNPLQPTSNYLC